MEWGESATGIRRLQKLVLGLENEKVPPGTWNHTAQKQGKWKRQGRKRKEFIVAGTPEIQENSELHED